MAPGRHNRFAALLLGALWALGPIASLLHESVAAHRYCAEHQELEDEANAEAQRQESPEPGDDDHERCAFAKACPSDRTLAKTAPIVAPAREALLVLDPPTTAPRLPVPLLANAPKTSPPRCSA